MRNIGPLADGFPAYGEIHMENKVIEHQMDVVEFPREADGKTIETNCMRHLRNGDIAELQSDYDMFGMHFPEANEPQIVRTALVCPGTKDPSKCAARVLQATVEGDVFTEMDMNRVVYKPAVHKSSRLNDFFARLFMRTPESE